MKDYRHSFSSIEDLIGEKLPKKTWLESVKRFFREFFGGK